MKPTAWLKELPPEDGNGMMMTIIEEVAKEWEEPVIPLYSKGAWAGLTDEDIERIKLLTFEKEINTNGEEQEAVNLDQLIRAAEQLCKEKNYE